MDKKIKEVLEALESNYNSIVNVIRLEKLDLDRRLEEAKRNDNLNDYEGIAKLSYKIASNIRQKESFEYSIYIVKNKLKKFEG